MADHFNLDLQQNNLKHNSLSSMDLLNNIGNAAIHENFSSNINDNIGHVSFSNEYYSNHPDQQRHHHHHQLLPMSNFMSDTNIHQSSFHLHHDPLYDPVTQFFPTSDQGPSLEPDSNRVNSAPQIFSSGFVGETKTSRNFGVGGGRKRKRNNEQAEKEKPREVVHVRARRGQATDSHSLAERLRREKINEKLRCLQDLVPGCYKTMGMAVMLDVIINYVRSLQNQIEFLSMKLSAASMFYDFNSLEMEAFDSLQGSNGYEPQVMERMVGEGYGGIPPQFQSTWPL